MRGDRSERCPRRRARRRPITWTALLIVLAVAGCADDDRESSTTQAAAAASSVVTSTIATTTTTTTTTAAVATIPTSITTTSTTTTSTTTTPTTTTSTTTTTAIVPPGQPTGVEASGPPCGGSGEVCIEWDLSADAAVTGYAIYRSEPGIPEALLAEVAAADLFVIDGRYQFIDVLFQHPPASDTPWPLCYSVAAIAGSVASPRSASACIAEQLPAPLGVSASGPPCGGSEEVCVRWEVQAHPDIFSYVIYRGEAGMIDGFLDEVLVADLFVVDGRYEYIDSLVERPPSQPDPYPLCYAVAAVDASGEWGSDLSEMACTSPG